MDMEQLLAMIMGRPRDEGPASNRVNLQDYLRNPEQYPSVDHAATAAPRLRASVPAPTAPSVAPGPESGFRPQMPLIDNGAPPLPAPRTNLPMLYPTRKEEIDPNAPLDWAYSHKDRSPEFAQSFAETGRPPGYTGFQNGPWFDGVEGHTPPPVEYPHGVPQNPPPPPIEALEPQRPTQPLPTPPAPPAMVAQAPQQPQTPAVAPGPAQPNPALQAVFRAVFGQRGPTGSSTPQTAQAGTPAPAAPPVAPVAPRPPVQAQVPMDPSVGIRLTAPPVPADVMQQLAQGPQVNPPRRVQNPFANAAPRPTGAGGPATAAPAPAEVAAQRFATAAPTPQAPAPQAPAAPAPTPLRAAPPAPQPPVPVPPSAAPLDASLQGLQPGNEMPEILKQQLLEEALRITRDRRNPKPAMEEPKPQRPGIVKARP